MRKRIERDPYACARLLRAYAKLYENLDRLIAGLYVLKFWPPKEPPNKRTLIRNLRRVATELESG